MCGRFTLHTKAEALAERFNAQLEMDYAPTYNAAPSQGLPVILNSDPGSIVPADWGFVPQWANGREGVRAVINARGESVADKPFFRSAFKSNRCIILPDRGATGVGRPCACRSFGERVTASLPAIGARLAAERQRWGLRVM